MATVINTSVFLQAASKIVKKIYTNSSPLMPLLYPKVFNNYEGDMERRFFDYLSLVGFGTFAQKPEGQVPTLDAVKEGVYSHFSYQSFALAYRVTKEAAREDPKGIIKKLPGLLRYSSDQTKEYMIWNILNLAFSTAVLLPDGQPLCSFTHPLQGASVVPGVTSYSNFLGAVPLTVETKQQAELLLTVLYDDRGLATSRTPRKLVYPPGLHQVVQEVLGSSYYPPSSENRTNSAADSMFPFPSRYLTAAPDGPFPWFIIGDMGEPGEDGHTMFSTIKWDEQKSFYDDHTESMTHKSEFRIALGAVDGRGVVGSEGG